MASPQKENGFTPIANEIMDALIAYRIPGEQRQCLDFIIRKTYGFQKREDTISNSQFVVATGLKKQNVSRALKSLIDKKLVIKSDNNLSPTYRFNKNYNSWKVSSKLIPVIKIDNTVIKSDSSVIKSDDKLSSKVRDTKERKKLVQKKVYTAFDNAENFYLTKKKRKLSGKRLEAFELFWSAFNYKKGRAEAADAWLEIPSMTNSLVEKIVCAAKEEAKNRIELKNQGRTPKMAQGWLSGRRWEDEMAKTKTTLTGDDALFYEQ